MRRLAGVVCTLGLLSLGVCGAAAKGAADEHDSMVITFRDGHQQKIPMADIARIEFQGAASQAVVPSIPPDVPGMKHFVGKWEVGEGNGMTFLITLAANGQAHKTIGASHGTWTVVNGEAEISWDDGWHDAIRKVGNKHEKFAFEPGKTFSDKPSNVTDARNTSPEPI